MPFLLLPSFRSLLLRLVDSAQGTEKEKKMKVKALLLPSFLQAWKFTKKSKDVVHLRVCVFYIVHRPTS